MEEKEAYPICPTRSQEGYEWYISYAYQGKKGFSMNTLTASTEANVLGMESAIKMCKQASDSDNVTIIGVTPILCGSFRHMDFTANGYLKFEKEKDDE